MDKLMSRIEDGKSEAEAATKVLACLKSLAVKTEGLKTAGIEAGFKRVNAVFQAVIARGEAKAKAGVGTTPKRAVGAGGSMAGRGNMKVRLLV